MVLIAGRFTVDVVVINVIVFVHFRDVRCFVVDRHAGDFCEPLFHQSADFELHGPLFRYFNRFQRLRVLGFSRFAKFGFKDTKISKFQPIAFSKLVYDFVEKLLDDLLDLYPPSRSLLGNPID